MGNFIIFKGKGINLSIYESFYFEADYYDSREDKTMDAVILEESGFWGNYRVIPCSKEEYEKEFLPQINLNNK